MEYALDHHYMIHTTYALYASICPMDILHQVRGLLTQNIEKVVQRGEKLDDLGDRAGMRLVVRLGLGKR